MNKVARRIRRKKGIRRKVYGTLEKPRITVFRSNKHIYVQAIDDDSRTTIASSSDYDVEMKGNKKGSFEVGKNIADKLIKKNIKRVVFDRNGYVYHGRVKSVAEGLRKIGLEV